MKPRDPERDLADATYGRPGWSSKVDSDLHDLKESSKRVEGKIATYMNRQTEWFEDDKKWKNRTEKRLDALEAEDDEDEITGVQSVDALKRRARSMRAQKQRMSRNQKIIAPLLLGVGAALIELIQHAIKMAH
jgi:uncharacterized protein YhaN